MVQILNCFLIWSQLQQRLGEKKTNQTQTFNFSLLKALFFPKIKHKGTGRKHLKQKKPISESQRKPSENCLSKQLELCQSPGSLCLPSIAKSRTLGCLKTLFPRFPRDSPSEHQQAAAAFQVLSASCFLPQPEEHPRYLSAVSLISWDNQTRGSAQQALPPAAGRNL